MGIRRKYNQPYVSLTIDNDESKENLLTASLMKELANEIKAASVDSELRYLILCGRDDFFCYGGSLGNRSSMSTKELEDFADALIEVHTALAQCNKITIAAINGKVGGGGFSLVEVCDLAVARKSTTFCLPEVINGRVPMISINAVFDHMTRKQCMELALYGTEITSEQALQMGLINQITENDMESAIKDLTAPLDRVSMEDFKYFKQYYNNLFGKAMDDKFESGKGYLISMLGGTR